LTTTCLQQPEELVGPAAVTAVEVVKIFLVVTDKTHLLGETAGRTTSFGVETGDKKDTPRTIACTCMEAEGMTFARTAE
jgi:hypothetical protein